MYDFLIDILHSLWRNGFSLTALGAVVFVILRQRKVKRKLQRLVPMLFSEDSEVKEYVQNQKIIIRNLKILFTFLGVEGEWNAGTLQNEKKDCRVRFKSLPKAGLLVRFARFITRPRAIYLYKGRNQKMKDYLRKLGSRKFQSFVIGFITQLFILFKLDEGLYVNEIAAAGLIITTIVYIYIEGSVDKARGKTDEHTEHISTSEFEG